jgi:hypothetical protein
MPPGRKKAIIIQKLTFIRKKVGIPERPLQLKFFANNFPPHPLRPVWPDEFVKKSPNM